MSDATRRVSAATSGAASKSPARSESVSADSTHRRSSSSGPASRGPARSESVPNDSTKRNNGSVRGPSPYSVESSKAFYDATDHSPEKDLADVSNHCKSAPMPGQVFQHATAPKYQR